MSSALGLVVDFREFGVNDVFLGLARLLGLRAFRVAACLRLLLLVHRLAKLHRGLGERIRLLRHLIGVAAFDRSLGFGDGILDLGLHFGRNLVTMLGKLLLCCMNQAFSLVLRFRLGAPLLVFLGELLGFLDHLVDV